MTKIDFQSLEDKVNDLMLNLHTAPVEYLHEKIGLTKYDASRLVTYAGIVSANIYLGSSIANALLFSGEWYSVALAGIVDAAYCLLFYRNNLKRAKNAEEDHKYISKQLNDDQVVTYQSNIQKRYVISSSGWYLLSEALILTLYIMSPYSTNPISVATLMLATSAIYASRFALLADTENRSREIPGKR